MRTFNPTCDRRGLLCFGPDTGPRQRLQVPDARRHPGKLDLNFLAYLLKEEIPPGATLIDPLAGSGSLLYATLTPWCCNVILNELEPYWVAAMRASWHRLTATGFDRPAGWALFLEGDARALPERLRYPFDALLTSPPYSDALGAGRVGAGLTRYLAEDPRNGTQGGLLRQPTYDAILTSPPYSDALAPQRHADDYHADRMGGHPHGHHGVQQMNAMRRGYNPTTRSRRQADPAQIGNLAGKRYAAAMADVWAACIPLVRPGGKVVIVVKNIVRGNQEVDLVAQTRAQLEAVGLVYARTHWRAVRPGPFHIIRAKHRPDALIIDREAALVLCKPEGAP